MFFFSSCGEKSDGNKTQDDKKEFGWKDDISANDIPDFPIKGNLGGKEVQFQYINFERWHGSNDNVINFSLVKPEQDCGFIEGFTGFTILNKGGSFSQGQWTKGKFADDPKTYQAFFRDADLKSNAAWNCALNIESINDKAVKGRILINFNDDKKSYIAGSFEALVCNN